MRRLLIVSPRFAPISSADNQRVLQMIPWMKSQGWEVCVAAIDCAGMGLPEDAGLLPVMREACVWRVAKPINAKWMRWLGIRALALRARARLDRLVRNWHAAQPFDLVFMSNTEFGLWSLAERWSRELHLPFVLDWQDPWVSDYYRQRPALTPPGGRLKFGVTQMLARHLEPRVARAALAHVCVSSHYIRMLRGRYPDIPDARFAVVPFPFVMESSPVSLSKPFAVNERYWAYAGRGGDDMRFALTAFFRAFAQQRATQPQRFAGLRLKFVGTSYADAPRARQSILPIAEVCGVSDCVDESPQRVAPEQIRALFAGAEALIVPGSDDPGYVASKIQSCLSWPKPMLAIFHQRSDVALALEGQAGVVACTFATTDEAATDGLVKDIRARWLSEDPAGMSLQPRRLSDHSPQAMSARLARLFTELLSPATEQNL